MEKWKFFSWDKEQEGLKPWLREVWFPWYSFFCFLFYQVTYSVSGFLDKNNDLLYRDLSQCLYACGHPLAKTLFPDGKLLNTGNCG